MSRLTTVLAFLVKVPLAIVRAVVGVLYRVLARFFNPVARVIDSSDRLSRVINSLSSSMATQRGLLLMIGIGIVLISLLVHGITIMLLAGTDQFDSGLYWLCVPATLLHVGILAGFVGILLAVPLGQGYKSQQQ